MQSNIIRPRKSSSWFPRAWYCATCANTSQMQARCGAGNALVFRSALPHYPLSDAMQAIAESSMHARLDGITEAMQIRVKSSFRVVAVALWRIAISVTFCISLSKFTGSQLVERVEKTWSELFERRLPFCVCGVFEKHGKSRCMCELSSCSMLLFLVFIGRDHREICTYSHPRMVDTTALPVRLIYQPTKTIEDELRCSKLNPQSYAKWPVQSIRVI